ncbi:MAG: phage major capsid protein, P2 family [Proteobacteria bacterium]|nr:phage major capsid protein, P2 family [Pseudomonadota bacterium]
MHSQTRTLFAAYVSQIALVNGLTADAAQTKFAVAPTVEQKLEEAIQESSEFLQAIEVVPVIQQVGQKVGLGTTRTLAGRRDTAAGNARNPTDPTDTADRGQYFCKQTNFDYAIPYAKIDAWRHKPDFQTILATSIAKQQGRDRIMIGWHGTSAAVQTDRVANPLLQDVNEGWLHKIRTNAPEQVLDDGDLTVFNNGANNPGLKKIYVKAGVDLYDHENVATKTTAKADYSSLEALVLDAKSMIPEHRRNDPDLVVIIGQDLLDDKYFTIAQKTGATATEVEATDRILRSEKKIGGLPAVSVPFFPANGILITTLKNLAIYVQEGSRRRLLKDEPKLDQVENYESVNEAYVVEDYDIVVLVENIAIGEAPARPAP